MLQFNLRLARDSFVLDISQDIQTSVTGLFGPSGSGKSTLLGMIAGFVKPDSGHLILNGVTLFNSEKGINLAPNIRRVGMLFQDGRLFPHLSIKNNLTYSLDLLPLESRVIQLSDVIEMLELVSLLEKRPYELSGGEVQRVALGRALLMSPKLLLLDEPLSSLDEKLKKQILPFLKRIKENLEIPMIYVSHDLDEIKYLTTSIMNIENGKIN
jgi:molybdate transport system ATP-binding protein